MASSPGRYSTAKCFQSAMQLTLSEPLVRRVSFAVSARERWSSATLHRLALARRQVCERMSEGAGGSA